MEEYINIDENNIENEHLCCIIRSKVKHPGVEEKRKWLKERIKEGHIFRKLNVKGTAFIEYAPLETAWVPITGNNYYYIYCLWVTGPLKGKGYGKKLIEYVIKDAKDNNKSGICLLGSNKQKAWLTDQSFAKKYGFEVVDKTNNGYELLALSFDGTKPKINDNAKIEKISNKELTIYYDMQCPYIIERIKILKEYCDEANIPIIFNKVDSLEKAKKLPCVFNNWCVFYNGNFETVNLIDAGYINRVIKRNKGENND